MEEQILFNNDPEYKKQEEEASYMERVSNTLKFLKYVTEVDCCQNCKSYVDGNCTVMQDYNGPVFETYRMAKCKHYAKKPIEKE